MADETFELTRKLRYMAKDDDYNFIVKYTIDLDPNNLSMQQPPKNSQASQQKIKMEAEPQARKVAQASIKQNNIKVEQIKQTRNEKTQRRSNRRMKKIQQLKQEQAEIFKNFNKFNIKKMKIKNDDNGRNQKNNKKNKGTNKNKMILNDDFEDDSQGDLDNLYHHFTTNPPAIAKRMSRSIDNTQKKQQPRKIKQKLSEFYEQKKNKKPIYAPYLNLEDIEDSRQNKQNKYFKGQIDFSQRVKNYARIFSKEIQGDLIVQGINKNRCIQNDQVYFEILPKQNPTDKTKSFMDQKIRSKVVYILPWKYNEKRQIVGKVQFTKTNKTFYLIPINKRMISFDVKFSEISQQNLKKLNEKYFLAEFTGWKETDQYPGCRIISEFGTIGDLESQTGALLINNGVQDKQYDQQTINKGLQKFLKCADENGEYKISDSQIKQRIDLRNDTIFTIDPLTAKDFDDALSIVQSGQNQRGQKVYQIGVHIADASFFVEQGGLIDQRAQQTTTSVYLVHRVLPMLPRVLCQTMCSLNPGLQRLTISVWFKTTSQGQILQGSRFERTIIKSKARFTYQQAQKIINKEINSQKQIAAGFGCIKAQDFDRISTDLKIMNSIAMKIREARIKRGSLIFQTPKKSFQLDQNYLPKGFTVAKRFQANFLVEEYMLLANQKVGQILIENIRTNALLRRHRYPSDKKIQKFQKFTLKINNPIKLNRTTPMQQQMNQVMKNPKIKQCIKDILNYEMIFLLEQAQYIVVGDTPKNQWLHYALNMPVYTHFTSPIRRYPDILVHRQLISIINARNNKIEKQQIMLPNYKKLKQVIDRCNRNKISAKKVSSGCQKIFLCLYLKSHPVFCKAVLTDLNQYCLSICVPSYDFRSAIQFKQLKKVKTLQFGLDSSQRKFVQLEFEYQAGIFMKVICKQMQQIDVKLTAKQGFPIDYMIRLMLPHPKNIGVSIACQ